MCYKSLWIGDLATCAIRVSWIGDLATCVIGVYD